MCQELTEFLILAHHSTHRDNVLRTGLCSKHVAGLHCTHMSITGLHSNQVIITVHNSKCISSIKLTIIEKVPYAPNKCSYGLHPILRRRFILWYCGVLLKHALVAEIEGRVEKPRKVTSLEFMFFDGIL